MLTWVFRSLTLGCFVNDCFWEIFVFEMIKTLPRFVLDLPQLEISVLCFRAVVRCFWKRRRKVKTTKNIFFFVMTTMTKNQTLTIKSKSLNNKKCSNFLSKPAGSIKYKSASRKNILPGWAKSGKSSGNEFNLDCISWIFSFDTNFFWASKRLANSFNLIAESLRSFWTVSKLAKSFSSSEIWVM